jgi:endonuclease III
VSADPFELILWEQVAYLVDDQRRNAAFEELRQRVGLTSGAILAAPESTLTEITHLGGSIAAQDRASRLRASAERVEREWGGDLRRALRLPSAVRALSKFPMIGVPGAEKILLFTRTAPILALDSNGLRVLLRLGYGKEERSYAVTYRSVREAVEVELKGAEKGKETSDRSSTSSGFSWLIETHQLLQRHGRELCRRSRPQCEACLLISSCPYGSR